MKKKYLGLILAVILMLSTVLCVSAEDEGWKFSDDHATLTNGTEGYELYPVSKSITFDPTYFYVHEDVSYDFADYGHPVIATCDGNDDAVFLIDLSQNSLIAVYTNEKGANAIGIFESGEYSTLRIRSRVLEYGYIDNYYAEIRTDYIDELESSDGAAKSFDVSQMDETCFYEIVAYDSSDCFSVNLGAVYCTADGTYYVSYSDLDNSYFDSDGNFSFRSGKVQMTALEDTEYFEEILTVLEEDGEYRYADYEYSDDFYDYDTDWSLFDENSAKVFIIILIIIFGYLFPCVPLVISLILPHTKKHGYTKRWYIMSALAFIWMILVTVLMVLLFT